MHDHNDISDTTWPLVLYLGADLDLPQRLAPLLAAQELVLHTAADRDEHTKGTRADYLALILELALLAPDQTLKDYLTALEQDGVTAPQLVVIAATRDIGRRLQALRASAAAYFVAPVAPEALAAALVAACRPRPGNARRVLVVDDDAIQTLLAERILTAAGFQVRTLTDPMVVLEVMATFRPDLILMDLNMPGADGAELAAIIREQDPDRALPILFLSSERDPERQLSALSMGGDAFIAKPIRPDLLVKAVTQRIESSEALRRRFHLVEQRDPATRLATRRHFMNVLELAIAQPGDVEPGSGLLLVAIDGAGQLPERLGPGWLEVVRERVGHLLQDQLAPSDLAVCLDEQYHALWVRRPGAEALRATMDGLLTTMTGTPLTLAEQSIDLTLSIGASLLRTSPGDALTLISRAEQACAEAQRAGGNRAAVYQPTVPGPEDISHEQRIDQLIARALVGSTPDRGFRLYYQPLVPVQAQGQHCLEALLRLTGDDGALIPARHFQPIAERCGRILAIDRWVMTQALTAIAQQRSAHSDLVLMIRMHLETLVVRGWLPALRAHLIDHGVPVESIVLGLAVDNLLKHRKVAVILGKMLHSLGIKVCLLDVDQTPVVSDLVTELRPVLVRLTVDTIRKSKPERLIALVNRLRQQETEVIAGGIDTPALIGPVWASGINYVQGTLIQPPLAEPVFDWDGVVVG